MQRERRDAVTTGRHTQTTVTKRAWTQHYDLDSGMPHCIVCLKLHEPQPDSPFCSEACASTYFTASSQGDRPRAFVHAVCSRPTCTPAPAPAPPPSLILATRKGSARRLLFERERGVCQRCGIDAHALYRRLVALPSEQARMQAPRRVAASVSGFLL